MSGSVDELARLSAANPIAAEPERAGSAAARATLASILEQPYDEAPTSREAGSGRAWWQVASRSSRRLSLLLVGVVLVGGTAVAATDPLGWWSSNPSYAQYGSNPTLRVHTPHAYELACTGSGQRLHCVAAKVQLGSSALIVDGHRSTAQPYAFTDVVRPPAHGFTRERMLAYVAKRRAAGKLSSARARKFRADLLAVPDSFFAQYEAATRYSTEGSGGPTRDGKTLLPPKGVAMMIVCEPAGHSLDCRNLNGDLNAPVCAGIYSASPAADWRYRRSPPSGDNPGLPPGISFTRAEYQVLIDMLEMGGVVHTVVSSTSTHRPGC